MIDKKIYLYIIIINDLIRAIFGGILEKRAKKEHKMSISERQEKILGIINERSFITVEELSQMTFTSASSIRRDLTHMQNMGLVKRTHGGVSVPEIANGVASFYDRTKKNIAQKRIIAKKAATLLCDGQSVLLDSSSSAGFLLPYIAKLKNVTVFTNNLATALRGVELGVDTHCLGGHAVNGSASLAGLETYSAVLNINADILFFSSQSLDKNGVISDSTEEETYVRQLMLGKAKTRVFLCDSDKFDKSSIYTLCNINDIDIAVFDKEYSGLECDIKII